MKNPDQKEDRWTLHSRIRDSGKCCALGKRVHCVCIVSVSCPTHGSICIGSHD